MLLAWHTGYKNAQIMESTSEVRQYHMFVFYFISLQFTAAVHNNISHDTIHSMLHSNQSAGTNYMGNVLNFSLSRHPHWQQTDLHQLRAGVKDALVDLQCLAWLVLPRLLQHFLQSEKRRIVMKGVSHPPTDHCLSQNQDDTLWHMNSDKGRKKRAS